MELVQNTYVHLKNLIPKAKKFKKYRTSSFVAAKQQKLEVLHELHDLHSFCRRPSFLLECC